MNEAPSPISARLAALREELKRQSLDGFLLPLADEYQNEYVPASARRVEFLTNFTGSSAFVIVLLDKAAFFTDSRYTLQASQQVPVASYTLYDSASSTTLDWMETNIRKGMRLGFDPWLLTDEAAQKYEKALSAAGARLIAMAENPIDALWLERPPISSTPVAPHDIQYSGEDSSDKRRKLGAEMKLKNIDAAVLTDPASVAWLLNVRGGDVQHTPLPLSFAILHADSRVEWFVDPAKATDPRLTAHLGPDVARYIPALFPTALKRLGDHKSRVRIDPKESAHWIVQKLREAEAQLDFGEDPCALPKACKNTIEMEGMRAA
ncbi:MAG: aminopeptidase P family protein, partial [Alphaproteobacteria bacterium]|nr:aminopeptidase P family protein [Alphaproteobacteria bacterium]